jgi:hypothetical protein
MCFYGCRGSLVIFYVKEENEKEEWEKVKWQNEVSMTGSAMLEHLQEFAKFYLANLVICQLPKLYAK